MKPADMAALQRELGLLSAAAANGHGLADGTGGDGNPLAVPQDPIPCQPR